MPMNFPDERSILHAAEIWKFRAREPGEPLEAYRAALADFVEPQGHIEAHEIRTGKGWDTWNYEEGLDLLRRSGFPVRQEDL